MLKQWRTHCHITFSDLLSGTSLLFFSLESTVFLHKQFQIYCGGYNGKAKSSTMVTWLRVFEFFLVLLVQIVKTIHIKKPSSGMSEKEISYLEEVL